MALKISYINQEAPSPKVKVDARLYRTGDGSRLVPEGHPDAAFLFCTPGREVSQEEFERFELDPSLEPEVEVAPPEENDQGEPEGSAEGQADDAEAAAEPEAGEQPEGEPGSGAEEKAVDGPPEDKSVRKRRTKRAKG